MTGKHVLLIVLVALILPGCAPSRLYFKPAGFASPVPPGMVVEEVITLSEGPPQSVLKVAAVGLYKGEAEGDLQKRFLHLRLTFLNNQAAPVGFYPGEVRVVPERGEELHPTLIEKTRRLAPGEPPTSPPTERLMPRAEAAGVPAHSLVQFDLFFDLPEKFKADQLENFVTYFKFAAPAGPELQSVAFTRVREFRQPGCCYRPAPVRVRFGFSYID